MLPELRESEKELDVEANDGLVMNSDLIGSLWKASSTINFWKKVTF